MAPGMLTESEAGLMADRKKPAAKKPGENTKEAVPSGAVLVMAKDLAEMFDLTSTRITQLRKDGVLIPEQTSAGLRYPLTASVRAYVRYLKDARNAPKTTSGSIEQRKNEAEADLKSAKAAIAELELKEMLGKMHRAEDVEAVTTDFVLLVRPLLMALPGRLAVDVAGAGSAAEASVIIRAEVNKLLEELSGYRYDPAEYARRVTERVGMSTQEDEDDEDED